MAKERKSRNTREALATLYCLRSMFSFVQAWIEEAIQRTHDGAGAFTVMAAWTACSPNAAGVSREQPIEREPT